MTEHRKTMISSIARVFLKDVIIIIIIIIIINIIIIIIILQKCFVKMFCVVQSMIHNKSE